MIVDLQKACSLLKEGKVIAFPTETVYGLAADCSNPLAVDEVFKVKQRPDNNPLTIMLPHMEEIYSFLDVVPDHLNLLMEKFWPGSLTLAMPVIVEKVDSRIRAGLITTGFRIPCHSIAQSLLENFGPIVAPSANPSGEIPANNPDEVERYFGSDFPVLENNQRPLGIASTVLVYADGVWRMVRKGAIDGDTIADVLGYHPADKR